MRPLTAEIPITAAAELQAQVTRWRERLTEQRAVLRESYFKAPSPARLLHRHRQLVDGQLQSMWRQLHMPPSLALIAVGGYGRGQLYPHSDIDLLILLPSDAPAAVERVEEFIGIAWDIGLEVGHGVRTVEQCAELSQKDITVQTNLHEARLLAGNRKLFAALEKMSRRILDPRQFYRGKLLEQEQRHLRYQDTNLEPNLKESAGGLRDLHTILWIADAAGIGARWSDLVKHGILLRREAAQLRRHEAFFEDLRIRLHYLSQHREERLVFDVQSELAKSLGYHSAAHRRASEHLMQDYYRTAMEIRQINTIVLQNLWATISPPKSHAPLILNPRFQVRNELLAATDENLFKHEPGAMLEAFVLLQQHPELKGMTADTLRALWRAGDGINPAFRRNPANRMMFMQILRGGARVTRELRRMHRYGVLGRYIPAFGRIVGQMQHDLYHVYTVDEHILKVIRNLRRFTVAEFAHEFPLCSRLMSGFARPEVLYLAGLFHDIAKGRGGDHSHLGKADAVRFCRDHGLAREDVELVGWLVENHLVMSSTAQKQDISDPEVVERFARLVGEERRLVALYLLTVADIRGTSPKVWSAWKAKLLEDLFRATHHRLTGEIRSPEQSMQQRQEAARAKLRLYALEERAYQDLWAQFDTSYFLRHNADEIAWHTRLLSHRVAPEQPVVKARISPAGEGLQVMVYAPDRKDLFARICAFFEHISYSVVEAKVCTTHHRYALDSFQIIDPNNKKPQYRDLIAYIEYELAQRLQRAVPLDPPAQGRASRQSRHFPISPEISLIDDERGSYKVLSVIASDRPGLLSRVARCLLEFDIGLHTARINTLGDRAEDVFLINGDALNNPKQVLKLENNLLQQLQ